MARLHVRRAAASLLLLAASLATSAPLDPVSSVTALLTRLLGPQYVSSFTFQVIPADPATGNDAFELDYANANRTVIIRGNKGLSLASGLGWYLKYHCNASFTWGRNGSGNQLGTVPPPGQLPRPAAERRVSPVKYRYSYNVCTMGYTTPWWGFTQWQEEIDRLALWGINLPLMFVGQERVWLDLYTSLGLSNADITSDFFTGGAFLPWQRMANIQRWAGPLDEKYINDTYALGVRILGAMRDFGMTPILPGWAGHIPNALPIIYPNANTTHSAGWNGFNSTYSSDLLLQPTDPLFGTIGKAYYSKLLAAFDVDPAAQFFNADSFNEMNPSSSDPAYLRATNAAIFASMPPNATYVMQGWLFVNDPGFWTPAAAQAYLSGVPDNSMLILDLFTESIPTWSKLNSFYGKPFIWCMLQVFGGRRAIYGNLTRLATGPVIDRNTPGSTMVGIGITPEATEMTPITFELILEMGWRAVSPDVPTWVNGWVSRRYGVPSPPMLTAAWATLRVTNFNEWYDYGKTTQFCLLCSAPQLTFSDLGDRITQPDGAVKALRMFLTALDNGEVSAESATFRYDLIDVARQVLCNIFSDIAVLAGNAYLPFQQRGVNTSASVLPTTAAAIALIADMDQLLAADVNFLLGNWIADARSWGTTPDDIANREFNAKNQITLWGPRGEINDYAQKNWAGLVGDYYMARWRLHGEYLTSSVIAGQPIDWNAYTTDLFNLEWNWNINHTHAAYPTVPTGDPVAITRAIASKYITSVTGQYTMMPGQDSVPAVNGVPVDMMQAWNRDTSVLQRLCDIDPACLGFNENGFLKNSTARIITGQATSLWLKTSAHPSARPGVQLLQTP